MVLLFLSSHSIRIIEQSSGDREMEEDQLPQNIKGFVIISLPPPDKPSLGKTITAFTVTDSSPSQDSVISNEEQSRHENPVSDLPIRPNPPDRRLQFSLRRLLFRGPTKFFSFFGIILFALFLYGSVSSQTLQEFRNSKREDRPGSFFFPLFPKFGILGQQDVKLKLDKLVDVQKENLVVSQGTPDINKLVASSVAAVDSSSVFPVQGTVYPDGLYFTYILVGNPPRRYFLDMDTGSDLTWIQCDAPCRSCAKGAHLLYKPARGSIIPPTDSLCTEVQKNQRHGKHDNFQQCDYEIEYADHSSSMGVLVRDDLHLVTTNGSKANLNLVFGCGYDQEGLLLNTLAKTDGIMGLSRAKVSLPFQLASKGIIKNVVGHCLSNQEAGGGYLFLGEDFVPYWGMTWTPMVNVLATDLYQTEILGIRYGNSLLGLKGPSKLGKLVFDTGSSYTYFAKEAYLNLIASLKEVSKFGLVRDDSDATLPICWRANFVVRSVKDVNYMFKTLTLKFGSKWWILSSLFHIPPEGYLIISNKGNVCLAILDGSDVHGGSTIILGDVSLRGYLVVYDNVNQRIGWERADCAVPRRLRKSQNFSPNSVL